MFLYTTASQLINLICFIDSTQDNVGKTDEAYALSRGVDKNDSSIVVLHSRGIRRQQ